MLIPSFDLTGCNPMDRANRQRASQSFSLFAPSLRRDDLV
jgi:hypothetical protein